jgi:hypothetical protein
MEQKGPRLIEVKTDAIDRKKWEEHLGVDEAEPFGSRENSRILLNFLELSFIFL